MNQYRGQRDSIRALVEDDRVHRDVYLSEELFALEQEHFFANTITPFMYMEARAEQQLVLGGVCRHTLEQVGGALRIRLKRVDLLNAEAALPAIQLFP